jgi:hypothetical protein
MMQTSPKKLRGTRGSQMAEVPLAMFILFFFFLFPLVNLISCAMGAATVYFSTTQNVHRAAEQQDYAGALAAFKDQATQFNNSGLAKFLKITPVNGYQGCGSDLYIDVTAIDTSNTQSIGPNINLPGALTPTDTSANLYQYRSVATYDVFPLANMSFIPTIGQIPGLGAPFRISFTNRASVEYAGGLNP